MVRKNHILTKTTMVDKCESKMVDHGGSAPTIIAGGQNDRYMAGKADWVMVDRPLLPQPNLMVEDANICSKRGHP